MKRSSLLFIILLFSSLIFSQNNIRILKTGTNVRSQPVVKKSTLLKQINENTLVVIIEAKGKWSFIQNPSDNNKRYWVANSRISKGAVFNRDANIRWNPSLKSKIIKQFLKGKEVIFLQNKNDWALIQDPINDKKGWVHKSSLNFYINRYSSKPKIVSKNQPPNCDCKITSPSNGDKNVNIKPTVIRWKAATGSPKPVGYYFSISAVVNGEEIYVEDKVNNLILRNINIGNVSSFSIKDLKPNTKYYIGLVPYNNIGLADCKGFFSFTTGSGIGSNTDNVTSSEQIIEKRLRDMGILSKWRNFKSKRASRISISNINTFINTVESYKGVPYRYGGTSRSGVDCSGLIYVGLRSIGYTGERLNAEGLANSGRLIANKSSLRPGDLVCFTNTTGGNKLVQHIAIYVGNNKFLHAPSSGKRVLTTDINDPYYWRDKFIFGVRLE